MNSEIPMAEMDDPLTRGIFLAFEHTDWDDIEAQDGDITRGLARVAAHVAKQRPFDRS